MIGMALMMVSELDYSLSLCLMFFLSLSVSRPGPKERSGGVMMRKLDPNGKLSRSNLTRRATRLSDTLGSWAHTAVNTVRKPN